MILFIKPLKLIYLISLRWKTHPVYKVLITENVLFCYSHKCKYGNCEIHSFELECHEKRAYNV